MSHWVKVGHDAHNIRYIKNIRCDDDRCTLTMANTEHGSNAYNSPRVIHCGDAIYEYKKGEKGYDTLLRFFNESK